MYLTNFLSFRDRTEFDFTSSKYSILQKTNVYDNAVLKGALFVGPNASGKSNALKGIGLIIDLIKSENISLIDYRCFFALTSTTTVEYEFFINNQKINYEISYNLDEKKLLENLTVDTETILFRDGSYGELTIDGNKTIEQKLDPNTLFLRTASFNTGRFPQNKTLHNFMEYLFNSYYIDGYNRTAPFGKNITNYAELYGVDKINQYLKNFNYDFFLEYGSESHGEGLQIHVGSGQKSIFFKRNSYPIPSTFYNESQGNQVFADMLPNIIQIIESPGMLVIDEFGNSLHNKLAEKIVLFFMKKSSSSQFFITSHDTNLISNSIFRPDQINLIYYNGEDGSKVKRVSSYKPREAQNLEKMYLGGMFEGLPFYD